MERVHFFLSSALTLLILSSATHSHQSANTYQTYTVYSQPNCEGKSETFTSSERHLNHVNTSRLGYFGQVKSRRIQSGVWREFSKPSFEDEIPSEPSLIDANAGSICITNVQPDMTVQQFRSIRMAGNSNLTSVGLSLFSMTYFSGEELYFDGTRLSLPFQQSFESWGYTGKGDWTIYDETNFLGTPTCLRPKATTGSLVAFETKTFLVVGSLHRHCYKGFTRSSRNLNSLNAIDFREAEKSPGLMLHAYRTNLWSIGEEVRLSHSRIFSSYSFSGNEPRNWTIYETTVDAEEKRFPKCLVHDGFNKTRPEALEFVFDIPLQIIGAKRGCFGDPGSDSGLQQLRNGAPHLVIRMFSTYLTTGIVLGVVTGRIVLD